MINKLIRIWGKKKILKEDRDKSKDYSRFLVRNNVS